YSYVLNNPVTRLDPDGHTAADTSSDLARWAPYDDGTTMESFDGDEFGFDALASIDAQHADRDALLAQIAGIPMSVRENVGDSVADSDAPDADDKNGGFHEEGGLFGPDFDGATAVARSKPSPFSNPDTDSTATIQLAQIRDSDLAIASTITATTGAWHVHPRGVGPKTGRTFDQGPSRGDMQNLAGTKLNFVVGAADKKVYFYDGSRVLRTMSLSKFLGGQ